METKDTLSSCSDSEEQEIQQLQKQAKNLNENSLNKMNALQVTTQHLSSSNNLMYYTFRDAFHRLFEADERTFRSVLSRNIQNLERQLNKETLHEKDSDYDLRNGLKRLNERKLHIQECKVQKVKASDASSGDSDCNRIVSYKENDQGLENQSNTSGDESSRSRNECNDKITSGDDTNIRPSYDTEPMVEVPYTNVFAVDTQHSEQPECIINTCVVDKANSNVTPDSPDMCDNEIQTDHNAVECDDERVALANLIANLKLDIDENVSLKILSRTMEVHS
ncbi:hypothetical protein Tco_1253845 [Tanacetum coccineum]